MKNFLLALLLIFTTLTLHAQQRIRGNGWEAVKTTKKGSLVVYYCPVKPFIYTDEQDKLTGIEYDIANEFAAYLERTKDIKLEIVWMKTDNLKDFYGTVQKGDRGTMGLSGVSISESKKTAVKFSPQYMTDISVLVSAESVPVAESLEDFRKVFNGKTALTTEHSTYDEQLKKMKQVLLPDLKVSYVQNTDDIIGRVSQDPNFFGYAPLPAYLLALNKGYKINRQKFPSVDESGYAFIFPTKSDWDRPINEFFNTEDFHEIISNIVKKHLGSDISDLVGSRESSTDTASSSSANSEILVLNKEKEIQDLIMSRQELKAQREQVLRYFLIFGTVFILLVAFLLYNRYREKQKANLQLETAFRELSEKNEKINRQHQEIEKQKIKLEHAYEHITDSIRYAKRIQESILPDMRRIKSNFPESFILFKPKDVLSGDFYWFGQKDHLKIIAAVDCTGHGVPGAFMTVMANALLNYVVIEKSITDPSEVLTELDKRVRENLRQDEVDSKANDGMDMALCVIDERKGEMTYAGAKMPISYIRNNEMQHIKGSKFPIGSGQYEMEKVFDKQTIQFQKGDVFYLYSDGYQDQFGGADGRKYLSKRMKEFFVNIHHLPLEEQANRLNVETLAWRGQRVQTDDILVMGLKF